MTDEQINAAIAEVCGWTNVSVRHRSGRCLGADELYVGHEFLPNYCTDLNAMHEAEKVLAPKNWNNFSEKWHDYYWYLRRADADRAIHATARQRAEAFLRTLGKWEEGK
jgi:transposase